MCGNSRAKGETVRGGKVRERGRASATLHEVFIFSHCTDESAHVCCLSSGATTTAPRGRRVAPRRPSSARITRQRDTRNRIIAQHGTQIVPTQQRQIAHALLAPALQGLLHRHV